MAATIAARLRNYATSLSGREWNAFWFTPADPFAMSLMRVLVGMLGLYYVGSYTFDLLLWFGPSGLLPVDTVHFLTGAGQRIAPRLSLFYLTNDPVILCSVHALTLAALVSLTIGFRSRTSSFLSLALVLSYVHRAPMIAGLMEPVLTMMLFYLCFAPSGAYLSVDKRLREKRTPYAPAPGSDWRANFAQRLMQVHLAALYAVMALTKLAGETWWRGEAVWWLAAHVESRLLDLTNLLQATYAHNAATHAIVIVEVLMATAIWKRSLRPILLAVSTVVWVALAILTGRVSFAAMMIVANLAFLPPETTRGLWNDLFAKAPQSEPTPS